MTAGSSRGCLALRAEHRPVGRLITDEDSPPGPAARQTFRDVVVLDGLLCHGLQDLYRMAGFGCTIRAIAQMKPTISRAIAVVTTTFGLPAAARRR